MKIAILTPAADYAVEWRWAYDVEAQALIDAGAAVEPVRWTDECDLSGFDLVVPLVAWGYHKDYPRWLRFLDSIEQQQVPIQNSLPLLRWNGDKAYLAQLGATGVPTVPTVIVDALDEEGLAAARDQLGCGDVVVKPPISASAYGTFRLRERDAVPASVRGFRMMAQPWIESIVSAGEFSLIYFGGQFSHAVSKVPVPGEFRVQPEYGGIISRCDPPERAKEVAEAALAAAPADAVYARVDLVVGNDGSLQLIELEMIEPAFFLAQAPDRRTAMARAILSAAERANEQPLADR